MVPSHTNPPCGDPGWPRLELGCASHCKSDICDWPRAWFFFSFFFLYLFAAWKFSSVFCIANNGHINNNLSKVSRYVCVRAFVCVFVCVRACVLCALKYRLGLKRINRIFVNNRIPLNWTNIFRGPNSRRQCLFHFSAICIETNFAPSHTAPFPMLVRRKSLPLHRSSSQDAFIMVRHGFVLC